MKIGITERGDASVHWPEVRKAINGVDGAILITKNPAELEKQLGDMADDHRIIVNASITGFGGTRLEPGVPDAATSIEAYHRLYKRMGDRCVLRVDPIILTDGGKARALKVIEQCCGRLRISFMDIHQHVRNRIGRQWPEGLEALEKLYNGNKHAPMANRRAFVDYLLENMQDTGIEICGEPGFECTGCVSAFDVAAMGLSLADMRDHSSKRQRPDCGCASEKTELLRHREPCAHKCIYCYWQG